MRRRCGEAAPTAGTAGLPPGGLEFRKMAALCRGAFAPPFPFPSPLLQTSGGWNGHGHPHPPAPEPRGPGPRCQQLGFPCGL